MCRRRSALAAVFGLAATCAQAAGAQQPGAPPRGAPPSSDSLVVQARSADSARSVPSGGTIAGRVLRPDDVPVAGATIRILGPGLAGGPNAESDAAGRFSARGVPPGVVRLEVRRLGYVPRVVSDVVIRAGKPAEVRVVLEPTATVLSGVTTRADYFPTVSAPATPVSTARLATEEIRRAPGVHEDAVRAVSSLPGVGPTNEGRNDLVVRGGAPVENLFVVDGVEVPNVNHFGTQGSTGGGVSLLPADFVREATLSTGGFGARWGDRASSVVDLALREGTRERVAGQVNLAATGAGVFAEGPLGGDRAGGSFLAAARRSYLDPVFRALGFDFIPAYHDATVKVALRPSTRDDLSWFAVGGLGTVRVNAATAEEQYRNRDVVAPNQTQYLTGLTWRRRLPGRSLWGAPWSGIASATLGRTSVRFKTVQQDVGVPGSPQLLLRAKTTEAESQLRSEVTWTRADGAVLEVGNVAKYADWLRYNVWLSGAVRRDADGRPRPLLTDTAFTAFRNATYGQVTLPVARRVRATLGVRVDYYAFLDDALRVAPRLSVAWAPDERSAMTVAGGRYWQAPQPLWLAGDPANPPDAPGGGVRPFRADHLVLGYQRLPRPDVQVRAEAYVKRYRAYPARVFRSRMVLQSVAFDNALTDIPFGLEPLVSVGKGQVVGAELLVQKKLSEVPVYGLASLALSRARFTAVDGRSAPSAFDQPVIGTVLAGWRPGPRWEISFRVRGASGGPTTPFIRDPVLGGAPDFARYAEGPRRPLFFQLDARADRRFARRGGRELVAYVDVIDVTGRRNPYGEEWSPRRQQAVYLATLGRLPTIGLNWVF
jgi:carboxypeptidase family protein/TonB-dependent receptor-like protein